MPINIYKFVYDINDDHNKKTHISSSINVRMILIVIFILISILMIISLIDITLSMIHNLIVPDGLNKEIRPQHKAHHLPATNPNLHNRKGQLINKRNHKHPINIMSNQERISRGAIKLIKQQDHQIVPKEIKAEVGVEGSRDLVEERYAEKTVHRNYLGCLAYLGEGIGTLGLLRMSAMRFIARMNS
jgi:hypothetical protein